MAKPPCISRMTIAMTSVQMVSTASVSEPNAASVSLCKCSSSMSVVIRAAGCYGRSPAALAMSLSHQIGGGDKYSRGFWMGFGKTINNNTCYKQRLTLQLITAVLETLPVK